MHPRFNPQPPRMRMALLRCVRMPSSACLAKDATKMKTRATKVDGKALVVLANLMLALHAVQPAMRFKPKVLQAAIETCIATWPDIDIDFNNFPKSAWCKLCALGLGNAIAHWRSLCTNRTILLRVLDSLETEPKLQKELNHLIRKCIIAGDSSADSTAASADVGIERRSLKRLALVRFRNRSTLPARRRTYFSYHFFPPRPTHI